MTFLSINQINYALNGILKKENLSSDTKISIRILYNEIYNTKNISEKIQMLEKIYIISNSKNLIKNISDSYLEKKYMNNLKSFLFNKFLNLHQIDFEASETLLYGMPQSGKSAFTFANIAIQLAYGKSCIFVVRNAICDAIHMQEKIKRFSMLLESKNFNKLESVYAGEISCNWEITEDNQKILKEIDNYKKVKEAIFSKNKKLVICLANRHQIDAINFLYKKYDTECKEKTVLFIDEADAISYGLPDIPTNIALEKLKETIIQKVEITATPWDNLVGNENLENQNIIVLEPPRHYHSIRSSIIFHELEFPIDNSNEELIDQDPNVVGIYEELSESDIYKGYGEYNHPIIVLHKTSTICKNHAIFFNYFKQHYKKWICIKENSSGTFMFVQDESVKTITINKIRYVKEKDNVFKFNNNIIIPQILQWLFDNGGEEKFPRIVITSGRFSGRSRSYVSTNGIWHLTHQYYGGASSVPALIQEMRLVHDRPDSIPLKCYAPKKVCKDIQHSAVMLDEQIDRLKEQITGISVNTFVKEGRWYKQKVPSKKLTIGRQNKNFKVKKVSTYDDGWALAKYNDTLKRRCKSYDIDEEESKSGKYTIIDMYKINKNSKCWKMLEDIHKILIEEQQMNKDISIDWINKKLKEMDKYNNLDLDNIRGNLWTNIRNNKKLTKTDIKLSNELLYWKEENNIFICLTN